MAQSVERRCRVCVVEIVTCSSRGIWPIIQYRFPGFVPVHFLIQSISPKLRPGGLWRWEEKEKKASHFLIEQNEMSK